MASRPSSLDPILCAPLVRKVDAQLIDLLLSLAPDEWHWQTIVPLWKVRHVAAHLLDAARRKPSAWIEASEIRLRLDQDLSRRMAAGGS
jgi:hypothetical protein